MEESYRVVFYGKVGHGNSPGIVKERLTRVFKLNSERIEQMFSGARVVLQKDLPIESALKYKQTFERLGALCEIEKQDSLQLEMESRDLSRPLEPHTETVERASGSTRADTSASRHDITEDGSAPLPANSSGEEASVEHYTSETGFFSLPSFIGLLIGGVFYVLAYAAIPWEGTLFGFELKMIAGSIVGLGAWNSFRGSLAKLQHESPTGFSAVKSVAALCVVAVIAFYGLRMYSRAPEKQPVKQAAQSITKIRLDTLQQAMNIIQGGVLQMDIPFPDTLEEIVAFIRTYRSLFPGNVWMMGAELFKDEWGTAIHYERHGHMAYTITSAGPDKILGTEDDFVVANRDFRDSPPQNGPGSLRSGT